MASSFAEAYLMAHNSTQPLPALSPVPPPFPSFSTDEAARIYRRMWTNRAKYHNGRARLAGVRGTVSASVLRQIVVRDGSKCVYCERELDYEVVGANNNTAASFDHVVALADGGPHTAKNIVCSCRGCNQTKNSIAAKLKVGKPKAVPARFAKVLRQHLPHCDPLGGCVNDCPIGGLTSVYRGKLLRVK